MSLGTNTREGMNLRGDLFERRPMETTGAWRRAWPMSRFGPASRSGVEGERRQETGEGRKRRWRLSKGQNGEAGGRRMHETLISRGRHARNRCWLSKHVFGSIDEN